MHAFYTHHPAYYSLAVHEFSVLFLCVNHADGNRGVGVDTGLSYSDEDLVALIHLEIVSMYRGHVPQLFFIAQDFLLLQVLVFYHDGAACAEHNVRVSYDAELVHNGLVVDPEAGIVLELHPVHYLPLFVENSLGPLSPVKKPQIVLTSSLHYFSN